MLSTIFNRLLTGTRLEATRPSFTTTLAFAAGMACVSLPATASANGLAMSTGNRTTQPIGHFEYCKKHFRDCNTVSLVSRTMPLTRERWEELVRVNTKVNATIEPVSDLEIYGKDELWTFPKTQGDCEDYVLLKRRSLMKLGWPASALLITVVRRPNGEGHAVLTARTDRGDYILDNMVDRISAWEATPYKFIKRQSETHTGYWVSINDDREERFIAANKNAYDIEVKKAGNKGLLSAYSE